MIKTSVENSPERLEFRQPLYIRLFHWGFTLVMLIILTTGFYVHKPQYWYPFRDLHQAIMIMDFSAYILIFLIVTRIYYGFLNKEYQNIILNQRDLQRFGEFGRYILFLKPNFQQHEKYNPFQKLMFCSWLVALIILAVTGLILYLPHRLQLLELLFGGLQTVRLVHYLFSVWFAITIPGHIYLALTSDPAKLQAMFTGYLRKSPAN